MPTSNATIYVGDALDPFSGAGTTGLVALKQGRHYIGIELSEQYAAMSARRLRQKCGGLLHRIETRTL